MTKDTTTDVGALLDEGGWSGYQKLLVAGTALTIIFDGLDNQLLGAAIPSMMREWSLPRPAFATVLAAALFGMMIGGFIGGYIGDRIGRRMALLGSVIWFGVLTRPDVVCRRRHDADGAALCRRARPRRRDAERRGAGVGVRPAAPPPVRRHADGCVHSARRHARGLHRSRDSARLRVARALLRRRHSSARPGGAALEGAPGVAAVSRPRSFALARARRAPAAPRTRRAGGRGIRRFARTRRRARVGRVALRTGVPPRHAGARRGVLLLPAVRVHRRQLGAVAAHERRIRRGDCKLWTHGVQPWRRRRRHRRRDRRLPASGRA